MRKPIVSPKGAKPRGPYTPAIVAQGAFCFVSAQGPIDPQTDQFLTGSFREQTKQVFDNVTVQLEAAGCSWGDVVKVQVFLADFATFGEMNEVYMQYVSAPYPARTTVHSKIGQSDIAVDCIAVVPGS